MAKRHFELLGGVLCLDFVNTIHEFGAADPREELHSYEDLIAFVQQTGAMKGSQAAALRDFAASDRVSANRVLTTARESRLVLYRIFSATAAGKYPPARDLHSVNRLIGAVFRNLQLQSKRNAVEWAWKEDGPNLERVLWPIIRSAADLLTSPERRLIRECGSQTCTWMFLDRSKNRTRLWCDMKTCGNRAKWHRYYQRQKKKIASATARRIL